MNGWPEPDDVCSYCGTCTRPDICGGELDEPAREAQS